MFRWSIRLGTLLGIPVYLHWTFLLLVGWFLAAPFFSGAPDALAAGARSAGFVLAVFGCVVLHEMGHALAARRYGIRTRDIVLLPIGGLARLERMPEKPLQELVVAVAGPLVNVAIAALIVPGVLYFDGAHAFDPPPEGQMHRAHFLASLGSVNIFLVVFNLIPAFPMDGGRILRSILAKFTNRVVATRVAAMVGQVVAVGFAIFGLFTGHVLLMLVALFVFLAAGAEAQMEQMKSALRGVRAGDAMMRRFVTLRRSQTLADAARELLAGSQQDFLVLADDAEGDDDASAIVGVLTRADLARGLASEQTQAPISGVMRRPCQAVSEGDDLQAALERARSPAGGAAGTGEEGAYGECPVIPVVRRDPAMGGKHRIVGIITPDNLTELVMIRGATERTGAR